MQRLGFFSFIKNKTGGALLLVLGTVSVLAVLAAVGLSKAAIVTQIADHQRQSVVLQYLAEAGIARMRAELIANPDLVNTVNNPDAEDARFDLNLYTDYGEAIINSVLTGPDAGGQLLVYSTASLPTGFKTKLLVKIEPSNGQFRITAYNEVYQYD